MRRPWIISLTCILLITVLWTNLGWFGRMPVGGDASRFGLGLMAELSRSLAQNRLPLWNSLWGYGFPALAESQLGVFYPPHLLLYSTLPLETAYTFDMALHAIWAALGAWLLARRLGQSPAGAFLAAVTFVTSGFFLVHEPHHWGWTTGSWLPWIFIAFHKLIQASLLPIAIKLRRAALAAIIISMPVLTGHFQLGFVGMIAAGIWSLAYVGTNTEGRAAAIRNSLLFLSLAAVLAVSLTMIQVLPTWKLAQEANQQRDWEYLSGFAAPPTHLIGLLMPALGRTVTFWRPLLWDQFHTSPEEFFFYVGLVPLWLALFSIVRTFRTERTTKSLTLTLLAALLLAAGPYLPGFSLLIRLPGFSFFRAPARWLLPATLVLSLLAGQGLELAMENRVSAMKSLRRFSLISLLFIILTIGMIELAVQLTPVRPGPASPVITLLDKARTVLIPAWQDRGSLQDWVRRSRLPESSANTTYTKPFTELTLINFNRDRTTAYLREAGPSSALALALFSISFLARKSNKWLALLLSGVMIADFSFLLRLRSIETAPMTAISSQSPLVNRLKELSDGQEWPVAVWGDLGNLPMAVGASPLRAYRTLDIPVMPEINRRMSQSLDVKTLAIAKLAGVGLIVIDPPTWASIRDRWHPQATIEEIDDPTLWAWMNTTPLARKGPTVFGLARLNQPVSRAWRVAVKPLVSKGITDNSQVTSPANLELLASTAKPMGVTRPRPETLSTTATADGPELWIFAQWADPAWNGILKNSKGEKAQAVIIPLEGGWQGVEVPSAGDWTLQLNYAPAYLKSAIISSVAAALIIVICLILPSMRSA